MTNDKIEKVETAPLAPTSVAGIEAILGQAVQQGKTGAELKELLDVYERMMAKRQEAAYNEALIEFQSQCPLIQAGHITEQYKRVTKSGRREAGRYAAEDDIRPIVNPIMARCGLAISFCGHEFDEGGRYVLHYELRHRDGHVQCGKGPPVEVGKAVVSREGKTVQTPPQVSSGTNTFARRITTINALGLTTTDDDDGRGDTPSETITDDQALQIEDAINQLGVESEIERARANVLKYIERKTLAECPASRFDRVIDWVQRMLEAQKQKQDRQEGT